MDNETGKSRFRIFILTGIILVFISILVIRLALIQIVNNNEYSKSIRTQSIRRIRIPAIRGRIISSDGKVIADSIPSYNIVFHLAEMRVYGARSKSINYIFKCAQEIADEIHRKLKLDKKDIITQMNVKPAMPVTIFTNLNRKELAIASEISPPIPGMEIVTIPIRYYPDGKAASNIIGYTGKEDPGSAPDRKKFSYYIPDTKGRAGLEKTLDKKINIDVGYNGLRGWAGSKLVRVNVKGYVHDDLGVSIAPRNGNSVILTLNWKAQKAAEKTLEGKNAALVLLNANSGAVIAMASSPTFDSNLFTDGISGKEWKKLLYNPERPLLNKPLMGAFMPGSIVKPLVALAALKAGINPNEPVYCGGAAKIGNSKIRCWAWRYGGHGNENMYDAIRDSCNVYFVKTGIKLGLDRLSEIFRAAGIGRKTGIGLPERSGLIPTRELKKKTYNTRWTSFDTGLISIGQGLISITPIQAALYSAAIANGGTVWKPYLIKAILNFNNKPLYKNKPIVMDKIPVSEKMIKTVQQGMYEVVNAPNGGGRRAKTDVITLYGKTGTAQIGPRAHRKYNTWFIGFGQYKNKLYSIAISVNGGRAGGMTNAPMAKKFFELWLS
ncbi:MAG TPA: penicillin-binding protein 2 [Victivallales bacterium]|nr:penicillin-binding protein 2 [Victivallales bacterium]